MRWLAIVALITLIVGCGGDGGDDDTTTSLETPTTAAATTSTSTAQAMAATSTMPAEAASPTTAAPPTGAPAASPPAREAVPTPIVLGSPAADLPVVGRLTATIPVGADPKAIAVGHGSVWLQNDDDGTISRIDPATNAIVATIPIAAPADPFLDERAHIRTATPDMAVDAISVWAIKPEEQAVVRIDPLTNSVVATIPLPYKAMSIAVDDSSLWVSYFSGPADTRVGRFDTTTLEAVATISDVPGPFGIAVAPDAVWVANFWDDSVTRIDPATNQVVAEIPISWPGRPPGLECSLCANEVLANEQGVWVSMRMGKAVARIDPATNRLVAIIPVGEQPNVLTSDARGVWVGHKSSAGALLIDPATNQVVAAAPAPDGSHQLAWIALWENTLWAVGMSTDDVVRIELSLE